MATLPRLIEEDVRQINAVLEDFLAKSEADAALVTAEGGFVIASAGKTSELDVTALGTLAANAGYVTQAIAKLIGEPNFNTFYQQGQNQSLLVSSVDNYQSLIVLFPARLSAGSVKYYATESAQLIAQQLGKARARSPGEGIDPISLNFTDASQIFKPRQG
jgi:predicted regulator of Ras-like GTPase activity (Roadblock/LC7/MglB family)